jgi:hypothetical protein
VLRGWSVVCVDCLLWNARLVVCLLPSVGLEYASAVVGQASRPFTCTIRALAGWQVSEGAVRVMVALWVDSGTVRLVTLPPPVLVGRGHPHAQPRPRGG